MSYNLTEWLGISIVSSVCFFIGGGWLALHPEPTASLPILVGILLKGLEIAQYCGTMQESRNQGITDGIHYQSQK